MKKVLVLALLLVAAPAMADYYVAGSFNGWVADGTAMTEVVAGEQYEAVVTGLSGEVEYKVTDGTWDNAWPTSNVKVVANGPLTINFFANETPGDGWLPEGPRAGYDDLGYGWDIMGSFNGWSDPVAVMTPRGDGIYDVSFTVATAGDYEFKFRKAGDWAMSVGDGFGNGSNIPYHVDNDGDTVSLSLDVANGRYSLVPEPATMVMLAFGAVALLRRR